MVAMTPDTVGGGTERGFQSRWLGSKMVACRGDGCRHEYFRHLCSCYVMDFGCLIVEVYQGVG